MIKVFKDMKYHQFKYWFQLDVKKYPKNYTTEESKDELAIKKHFRRVKYLFKKEENGKTKPIQLGRSSKT